MLMQARAQQFRAGLMGGFTITDVDGADLMDNDTDFHKFGFSLGGLVNSKISPSTVLQMELAYIQKGSLQGPDSTHTNNYYTMAFDYVDASLLLKHAIKLKVDKVTPGRISLEAGLTLGRVVRSSYSFRSIKYSVDMNKTDLSALVGINYKIFSNLFIDFRYSNSLIHAIKHNSNTVNFYPYATFQRGNNLVFQLTLGYIFDTSTKEKEQPSTP